MPLAHGIPRELYESLSPSTVRAHLISRDWEIDERASFDEAEVYRSKEHPSVRILLPRDTELADYASRMADIVHVLSSDRQSSVIKYN